MSSQTIVELIESPSQPAAEGLLESTYEGRLSTHSVKPSPHTTRPNTPESDPEIIVNTPSHTPDHQLEDEVELNIAPEHTQSTGLVEPQSLSESSFIEKVVYEPVPEKTAYAEENIQAEHEESEGFDTRTLVGSEGHNPSTLEEVTQSEPFPESLPVPKKSKKSKRKESKKEKKKKKVIGEPIDSETVPENFEEAGLGTTQGEFNSHSEELQEDSYSAFHTSKDTGFDQEIEQHAINPGAEELQENDSSPNSKECPAEGEIEPAVEVSEEFCHNPEEPKRDHLEELVDVNSREVSSAVFEPESESHNSYHVVEEIEVDQNLDPVIETTEQIGYDASPAEEEILQEHTTVTFEEADQDQPSVSENHELQQDPDPAIETLEDIDSPAEEENIQGGPTLIYEELGQYQSSIPENHELQLDSSPNFESEEPDQVLFSDTAEIESQNDVNPEIYTPPEEDPDTPAVEDGPAVDLDCASHLSSVQQKPSKFEPYPTETDRASILEDSATLEPELIAEEATVIEEELVFDQVIALGQGTEEKPSIVESETEPALEETKDQISEPYLKQEFAVPESELILSVGDILDTLDRSSSPQLGTAEPEPSAQYIDPIAVTEPIIQGSTPEPRHYLGYASTVEDSPEEVETPPPSDYSDIRMPETTAEIASNTSTMALQDRSVIASQLSDALALFNSFDESVKSLVTRLQSNENNFITKPEHDGSTPITSAAFHVPYSRNPNFHGRFSTLSQIFGMWRPQQRCRIAVAGLGGLGKTELVLEFVYRARQVSPSTPVFWFGPDDIRSKESSTSAAVGLQLEDWLRGHQDPGSMLVVDSGDRSDLYETSSDRGSFVDHLRNFQGTVILISRNARDGNLVARPHEICEVRELELDACVNLMCDHLEIYAHDASTEREIQDVVKSLNCIPRAIIQVTKVINSTQMTVSQFYEMYSTSESFQLRLFSRIEPYSKPDHDMSVIGRGVFDLRSFRKSHLEPSRLLYQIYYLGGKAVPYSLVSTDDPLNKILLMLTVRAYFMIEEDVISETFSIHPMVYLAMRKALGSERPLSDESEMLEERKWYDEVVLAFSKHYPDANCENRAWWKECFSHLISGYNLHSDTLRIAIATVYHRESSFFKRKGAFAEALKMASQARSVLPDPVPSECLAIVQDQITLLDFLAKYREVHEMLRGLTMEVGHPGNLWKKSMMAKLEVADCANRYDSAIEIFRQVRTAGEAANADRLDLSNATDDLSMALMQKGKYREAAVECRKALAERSSRLGSSHTDTLSSCHNLAEILHKDGKFEEAHRYIQEALRGRETVLGAEHPETLHSKVLRARILISKATTTSDFDEAEAVLNYAIEKLGAKLSPHHPIVMTCKSEIARIMFARGKYETAEAMNQSVLAAREQGPWLEPATHPDTMTSRNQLADVIRLKDGSKAADNLSERCLTERTVVLTNGSLTGDDFHPDQLASLHNRAVILSGLGQHLAALQKIDLALLGRKAILGEHHPDYFISMTWKGEIMRAQLHRYQSERTQTLDTIENLHKQAYEGLSWILGSEHQSSLQSATHMALAKRERGSPASSEAEGLFRQIHCAYQHNMGDFHPETLKSKGRLAEAMRAASPRHHLEAKKLWRDSCGGLTRIYGFDAHVTANAYKGYEKFLRTYPDP